MCGEGPPVRQAGTRLRSATKPWPPPLLHACVADHRHRQLVLLEGPARKMQGIDVFAELLFKHKGQGLIEVTTLLAAYADIDQANVLTRCGKNHAVIALFKLRDQALHDITVNDGLPTPRLQPEQLTVAKAQQGLVFTHGGLSVATLLIGLAGKS